MGKANGRARKTCLACKSRPKKKGSYCTYAACIRSRELRGVCVRAAPAATAKPKTKSNAIPESLKLDPTLTLIYQSMGGTADELFQAMLPESVLPPKGSFHDLDSNQGVRSRKLMSKPHEQKPFVRLRKRVASELAQRFKGRKLGKFTVRDPVVFLAKTKVVDPHAKGRIHRDMWRREYFGY